MVSFEGVAFGVLLALLGAGTALFPGRLSALHARVISTRPVHDAETADGMRRALLKPIGVTVAGFGLFIAVMAYVG